MRIRTILIVSLILMAGWALSQDAEVREAWGEFLAGLSEDDLQLSVTMQNLMDGAVVHVQNVGRAPTSISAVEVQDRPECKVANMKMQSQDILVGNTNSYLTGCPIVRLKITTNRGHETYTFSR